MVSIFEKYKIYIAAIISVFAINIFSWRLPFFWDTILTSTITQHFFENGFGNFIPPPQFDAGHPPLFYIYITLVFKLFGKSLISAHLGMLPFHLLGVVAFIRLLEHFAFTLRAQWLGFLLFMIMPTALTQYSLISYDAVLLSLYLTALVAFFENRKLVFSFVLIGIVGVSLRGLFCVASLAVTIFLLNKNNLKSTFNWILLLLPAIVIISFWYGYHYKETGWLLSTNAEGWAQQRGVVNIKGLLKNGISIARCFFDVGIFVLSLISLWYLILYKKINENIIVWLVPAVLFSVVFLPFSNPINHRYFLIVYVLMLLSVIPILMSKKIIFTIVTIGVLMFGHFLIYPQPISNGWDCSLVHIGYSLNKKYVLETMENSYHIDRSKVGAVFPVNTSLYQSDMLADTIRMLNVNGKSIDSLEYVLYATVCNDFSDEQLTQLKQWNPLFTYRSFMTEMIVYKNPKFHTP